MSDKFKMDYKFLWTIIIYLIIFPLAGCAIGYVSYFTYELVGNDASKFHLWLFILIWSLFGLLAGIHGIYTLNKLPRK